MNGKRKKKKKNLSYRYGTVYSSCKDKHQLWAGGFRRSLCLQAAFDTSFLRAYEGCILLVERKSNVVAVNLRGVDTHEKF